MTKISYHSRWAEDGTHYNQAIKLDKTTLNTLDLAIRSEQDAGFPNAAEYANSCGYQYVPMYLRTLRLQTNDCRTYFLNLCTRDFINRILNLPLKNRNTCLLVK